MKNAVEISRDLSDPSTAGVARLKEKRSQLIYQLGKLVDDLSRAEAIQFLFVSEHQNAEKEIQQLLEKMNDLDDRIRLQGGSLEDDEEESDFEPEDQKEAEEPGEDETAEESAMPAASFETTASRNPEPEVKDSGLETMDPEPEGMQELSAAVSEKSDREKTPTVLKAPSVAVKPVCGKRSPIEPVILDYQALAEGLHFYVPGEERRFAQLLDLMNHEDEAERLRGFNRIACSFEKEYICVVARLAITDPSVPVRRAVLKILARLKINQAVEIYQHALHDPESSIRINAIKGLGMLLFEKSFSMLRPLLDDEDPSVRSSAASYLGLYCREAGIAAVSATRKDPSPLVRKSVANILGIVKPPKAVMLLEEMLSDDVSEVKEAVKTALSKVFKYKPIKRF